MVRFIAGLALGLLIAVTVAVTAQQTTTGSGTGATLPSNLLFGTASSSRAIEQILTVKPPTSFIFTGKGHPDLLRIDQDGTVTYLGRVLGIDKDVWDGIRAVFNPWRVCQELEERAVPWTSGGRP